MQELKIKHNRRTFIKTSAAAGGGILFGFNFFSACQPVSDSVVAIDDVARDWTDINAFLKIAPDGFVTIMSPNPEIGQGVKTSMPMIIAEELEIPWEKVVVEQAPFDKSVYTRQVAGGSQSIRQGWEALRTTGATAKQMMINAAAQDWQVPASECNAKDGAVHHSASGESKHYGELIETALTQDVPETVTLKETKDFTLIGTDVHNVDNHAIVTGKPLFGIDTKVKGMSYAAIIHPPSFGQKLKSVDDTAARAMDGVEDVITFDNNVAVIGKSTWEVFQAKDAVNVEYDIETPLESTDQHNQEMLALLDEASEPQRKDGNPERAFAEAAEIVESIYECPLLPHNTMEPMNFFAHVTDDKAEFVGPIQTPDWTHSRLVESLGMKEEQITIMMTRMGGGFGRRLYGDFVLEAGKISQLTGKPIQLVWTREDDMSAGTYRPACKYKFRAALDADGNITAYHIRGTGINQRNVTRHNNFPAGAIQNYLADSHNLESNVTVGAWRAPITNFLAFAEQSFLDEIALKVGKDPVEFRLALYQQALDNPVGELSYEPQRFIDVIKLAAEKSNWGNAPSGVHQGFSVYYSHNSYVAQVAEVVLEADKPVLKKIHCAVDCGIVVNPLGALNQIEGGMVDGIGHAMYGELTIKDGAAEQHNFDAYRLIRMPEAPASEIHFVDNGKAPTGLGEPTLPPVAGALGNAIFSATGERLRKQPFVQSTLLG